MSRINLSNRWRRCGAALSLAIAMAAQAQQPARQTNSGLQGRVTDETGAAIPGAVVTVSGAKGSKQLLTNESGTYTLPGLAPGKYAVRVDKPGFASSGQSVEIAPARTGTVDVKLKLQVEQQEITVLAAPEALSTDAAANASALVMNAEDLAALSDDPDEMLADLKALAGPVSGPKGSQVYVDGFKSGRLPPKESIREVRINQNPFSAEYDRMGLGRIEVFTKPGASKFHGMLSSKYGNAALNSRNPYALEKPRYYAEQSEGSVNGPLGKRASFMVSFEERRSHNNSVIHATILDPALNITPFSQAIVGPSRQTIVNPRLDVQLSRNHTLTGRYEWEDSKRENAGVGTFDLTSHAYNRSGTDHTVQLTETGVLGPKAINETRFQFLRNLTDQRGDNSQPTVVALDAFTGGGSPVGHSYQNADRFEIQNNTSYAAGTHMWKFGVRARALTMSDYSAKNFGGTFTFSGGLAPELDSGNAVVLNAEGKPVLTPITSIQRYQRTLLFQRLGYSALAIRALGGGASQFTINTGAPGSALNTADAGLYLQHDWRVAPSFTMSMGLRYEFQNHVHDWTDAAPRLGFAWAPGGRHGKSAKTVIRGGAGFFYDRFGEDLVLQTLRFNGATQRQFIVHHPDFFPTLPTEETLEQHSLPLTIRQADRNLRTPRVMQTAIAIERQLPFQFVTAVTYLHSHTDHLFNSRNINAPLPGTFQPDAPASGVRPYGTGNIYQYESNGVLNQDQVHVSLSRRFRGHFSIFGYYSYGRLFGDSDGAGSFPANQYDLHSDYGRADMDIRHQYVVGSSIIAPYQVSLSPFVTGRSGAPFDIVTGSDANGDSLFNDRPAFARALTDAGVVATRYGVFDPTAAGSTIPRNYGEAPGYFNVNLRVSRTFGFGAVKSSRKKSKSKSKDTSGGDATGAGMLLGADERNVQSMVQSDSKTEHRFNLNLSITARNLLNHVNPGIPVGNLSSPLFGTSNWLASSAGPDDEVGGNNRRIVFRMRLGF